MRRFVLVLLVLGLVLIGGNLQFTLEFSRGDLVFSKAGTYDVVEMRGYPCITEPGKPRLPVVIKRVLIPSDAVPVGVKIVDIETEEISGEYYIYPAQPDVPLPMPGKEFKVKEYGPDEAVYNSRGLFPGEVIGITGSGRKNGYRLVHVRIYPLRYIPVERKLVLVKRIRFEVEYVEGKESGYVPNERIREEAGRYVKKLVINPEDVERFAPVVVKRPPVLLDPGDYEYVIITNDAMASTFQTLADWKTKKGVPATVVTVSWIESNYSGYDTQEKIKSFIIDAYNTWGTKYVLLGGQADDRNAGQNIVPAREAYYTNSGVGAYPDEDTIPSDLYYADLDNLWDANNNHVWGELSDNVDMYADVYVGRMPVLNSTQAQAFINKVLTYEKNPPKDYLTKLMLPTGILWSSYEERPMQDSIARMTPTPPWFDAKMYERNNALSEQAMIDSMNAGYAMGHWEGHGNETGIYYNGGSTPYLTSSDADGLTNGDRVGIAISIACFCGAWDEVSNGDCFAEHLVLNPNGGLVAVMMNSRYGWGAYVNGGYVPGPSERLDTTFFAGIFEQNIYHLGDALFYSKDTWVPYADSGNQYDKQRWCIYELNLLGDPELPLWTETPENMSISCSPDPIPLPGGNITITVTSGGSPVANALVCVMKGTEAYAKGYTNSSGQVILNVNLTSPGWLQLTATAQNKLPVEDSVEVITANKPYPVYDSSAVVAGGDDVINPGEQVNATIWVRNQGTVDASGVYGILSTSDGYVTSISQDSAWYGDISAGGKVQGVPDYIFDVSINTPDQHVIMFDLTTHDVNDSVVVSHPTFTVNAPNIEYVSDSIVEGIWMPGDQVHIILEVSNSGHQGASVVSAVLETNDSYVSIDDGNSSYPDLGIGVNGDNSTDPFVCTASSSTPQGHVVNFKVIFTYNSGMVDTVEFSESIGVAGSDWADHDIGNTVLTVTRYGSIGYMDDSQGAGHGWQYPAGSNGLFIGSFAAGTSKDWVSDRFYSSPSGEKADWVTTTSPDGMVRVGLPGYSQQNSVAWFDDSGHPSPVGLKVKQVGWAWSNSGADDFVILKYVVYNEGGLDVSGIYFGVFLDLDIGSYSSNLAGRDEARSLAYVIGSSGSPYMGVRALDDSVSSNRRASVIYNSDDVYPWSGMPDSLMYLFMSGQFSRDTSSSGAGDYGAMAAVGPYNIPAGDSVIAAFALVGGNSLTELLRNSDTAFVYYWNSYTGIEPGREIPKAYSLEVPWMVNGGRIEIRYGLPEARKVEISVYDVSGRSIYSNKVMRNSGYYSEVIDVSKFASGVYFVKVKAGSRTDIRKTTIIR